MILQYGMKITLPLIMSKFISPFCGIIENEKEATKQNVKCTIERYNHYDSDPNLDRVKVVPINTNFLKECGVHNIKSAVLSSMLDQGIAKLIQ